jgi:hypothetical protein
MTDLKQHPAQATALTTEEAETYMAAIVAGMIKPNDMTQAQEPMHHTSTDSHGYCRFPAIINDMVPSKWRESSYEEDCAWAKPVFCSLHQFATATQEHAIRSVISYYPELFERITGQHIPLGVSYSKDCKMVEAYLRETGQPFADGGHGDWCFDVPKGFVFLYAARLLPNGQKEKIGTFLVPQEDYNSSDERQKYGRSFFTKLPASVQPYTRNEEFYTWDHYTQTTGKPRYK